jgi:multiple sugar transport system substrate-binding protein
LTYEEVVGLAKQAQAAGAQFGFLPEQIDRYYQLQPMFESAGAGSGLTGEGNLTPDITSEAWVEAGEFYASLFEEGVAPRGVPVDQMQSVFTSGDVAFYIGGPWNLGAFDAAEGLNYGVAPVPYFEGGTPATPTDSWAVAVSPYAAHPEEARMFAEYMTLNPEGAAMFGANNPVPPVNAQAYEAYIDHIAGLNPEVGEDVRAIITHELANTTVSRPRSVGYVAFEEVMNRAFSDIRNGAEVRATLEQASQQLESTLARIQ